MLLKLILRNVFRHKLRTALTVLGIGIAVLSFGMLRTVIDAWYAGVSASSATRLVTRNSISLIFPLPLAYREKIRAVDGVSHVSYGNWFGGYYVDEKNFFANFAVEIKSYLEMYPEYVVSPDQKESLSRDRRGCVVGRKLADRFHWKIGDAVTLKGTIFPGNWDFVVRAIYTGNNQGVDESQFFFHWDYLNEMMKKSSPGRADQIGFYMVGVSNPDDAANTALTIDQTFKNSFAETLSETEKAFQMSFVSMSEAILWVIQIVSLVIIVIIMVVAANTMAMSVRERLSEYAVFKTLGFSGFFMARAICGEAFAISGLGCLAGILATYPAAEMFRKAVGQFFPVFHVSGTTILLDIGSCVLIGGVASVFPVWKAVSVRVSEALGRLN